MRQSRGGKSPVSPPIGRDQRISLRIPAGLENQRRQRGANGSCVMRIMIVAACMCVSCSAYAAIPCQTGKTGDAYWSWREVDGRRCWYQGRPGKPKDQLYWQKAAKAMSPPAPQAPAPMPVVTLHVTPTTPETSADILRAQP